MPNYVKNGGVWREAKPYVKTNAVWKEVQEEYIKSSGVWKSVFKSLGPYLFVNNPTTRKTARWNPADFSVLKTSNAANLPAYSIIVGADNYIYTNEANLMTSECAIGKYDPISLIRVGSYTSSDLFTSICYGADGYLYSNGADTIKKINPSNMSVVNTLNVSNLPYFISAGNINIIYASDGYLYILRGNSVYKINTTTLTIVDQYTTDINMLVLIYDSGYLYIGGNSASTSDLSSFLKLNASTMSKVVRKDNIAYNDVYTGLIGEDGYLYFSVKRESTHSRYGIVKMDSSFTEISRTPDNGDKVLSMAYGKDSVLYYTTYNNDITARNPSDLAGLPLRSASTTSDALIAYVDR